MGELLSAKTCFFLSPLDPIITSFGYDTLETELQRCNLDFNLKKNITSDFESEKDKFGF